MTIRLYLSWRRTSSWLSTIWHFYQLHQLDSQLFMKCSGPIIKCRGPNSYLIGNSFGLCLVEFCLILMMMIYNSICGLQGLLYLKPMEQLWTWKPNISRCNKKFIFQSINCQTSKWRVRRLVDYDKLLRKIGTISWFVGREEDKRTI
jgi:hypothetical protein